MRYIDQIGQALECVHERKLLHRDVKPNNILLRRESKEAVLIDFGLAREFQPGKIRSMTAMITEGYAPIEQYERRGDFGYYTDVYALAATLYSLLTNRVPIPANYRAEEDVNLSPPQKFNQNISDKVNAAILKGMELEPFNRPQTVREFRELLGLVVTTPQLENSSSLLSKLKEIFILPVLNLVNQEVQLKSSCGMDYRKLRDLLAAGKWKEADYETGRVMLAIAKREEEGWLDVESIDNFPWVDLSTIDQLWVKYSDGKFGFSVQKRIYQGLGGTREYNEDIWEAFGDKVGWKNKENRGLGYKNMTFDEKAQKVNFPNYTILGETDIQRNWLYYKDITFDKKAPEAHLPIIIVTAI